jgi:F-type H+-transporting ATPase subunit a
MFEISYFFFFKNITFAGNTFNFILITLYMFVIVGLIFITNYNKFFKTSILQFFSELNYKFFLNIFKENIVSTRAQRFFPFLYTIFFLIFYSNFLSLFFYDVSSTAHIIITLFLAFSVFFSFFIVAFLNYDLTFVRKFIENDISIFLKILLFFIELISFFIRPFSLSIRLFTNMLSGHILLHIFASFFIFIIKNYAFL